MRLAVINAKNVLGNEMHDSSSGKNNSDGSRTAADSPRGLQRPFTNRRCYLQLKGALKMPGMPSKRPSFDDAFSHAAKTDH